MSASTGLQHVYAREIDGPPHKRQRVSAMSQPRRGNGRPKPVLPIADFDFDDGDEEDTFLTKKQQKEWNIPVDLKVADPPKEKPLVKPTASKSKSKSAPKQKNAKATQGDGTGGKLENKRISSAPATGGATEKRLKRHRKNIPTTLQVVKDRAMAQRMFVLDRAREGTDDCPEESVQLAGSTGNVYNVRIAKIPSCNCPHAKSGHHCKHLFYVLCRALRVPEHLEYQAAYLSSELQEIFENAPPIPQADAAEEDGNRKPVEDDCPICCMEFEANEDIIWCKAACGNNVHRACFDKWASMKRQEYGKVTCPFCRTPWQEDGKAAKLVAGGAQVDRNGYVNVGQQLGLPQHRDTSTYHPFAKGVSRYIPGAGRRPYNSRYRGFSDAEWWDVD